MRAAVIRSASPSSRDKGDPHYCFRSLDSMKFRSGAVVWALIVCGLVPGVFWKPACSGSRSKFPVVVAKVFRTKFYDPLPSMLLLPTVCLSFVLLQDGARSDLRCFLHELADTISCWTQYVFSSWTKSFFLHEVFVENSSCHQTNFLAVVKIRHSDWRNESWSLAWEWTKAFGFQILDSCNQSS